MEVFQHLEVLSKENFIKLVDTKRSVMSNKGGEITIESNGNTIIRYVGDNGMHVEQNSITNYKMDIEGFKILYPDIFITLLYSIQNAFISKGFKNPKVYTSRTYTRNKIIDWHKHFHYGDKNIDYCVIYYMHPNWDIKNGGRLNVSKTPAVPYKSFDCFSNSFVAHNGHYGHSVDVLKNGYDGDRDIFLSHWIVD